MQRATSYGALSDAVDVVFRGRKRKESAIGRWVMANRNEFIEECSKRMLSGSFRIQGYHEYTIVERGKQRHIQCIRMEDRVCLNALMKEVQRCLRREFISNTASSIEGRGCLWLHKKVLNMRREHPEIKWFYKCDIRKFYESIPQSMLLEVIERKFREPLVRQMLRECVTMLPKGISIGLRASQEFGNLYLSVFVDHRLKDDCGCKWYFRYCDDIVIGARTAEDLTPYIDAIHDSVEAAGLDIKPSEQVFSIADRPIDFLGYVIYEDGRIAIRRHIKQRFARRWKRTQSRTRRRELAGSFFGMAKHAHTRNLFNVITGWNMRDFAELGIKYVAQDGKKHFDCPYVSLNDVQNRTIIIKDFETGISTKEGPDRYVVLFENEHGTDEKFITNSAEMKQILDKAVAAGFLPFRTTIVRKRMAENKCKYCFT